MKSFLSLVFVSTLLFTSCKKEVEAQTATSTTIVPFTEVGRQLKNENAPLTQQQNSTPTPTAAAKGLNPAHGQPGHRCDIPVGSPLSTPVSTNNQTTAKQNSSLPVVTTTAVATPAPTPTPAENTPTAEGMNPPHGQTNHRCDIAVGAPLPKQ